jgi:prolyl-tRNA synthetase
MGCYGIGVSRLISAIVEQYHDDKGIIWPENVAPFDVHILVLNTKDQESLNVGFDIYKKLKEKGLDVLLDERDESPGAKFKDADLIGIPHRIVIGKALKEGKIEYQKRDGSIKELVNVEAIVDRLMSEYHGRR